MALLKEDGSLDIERIYALPIEDFIKEIESLTDAQVNEFLSKSKPYTCPGPTKAVVVDYTLEDELARGGALLEDVINNLVEKI